MKRYGYLLFFFTLSIISIFRKIPTEYCQLYCPGEKAALIFSRMARDIRFTSAFFIFHFSFFSHILIVASHKILFFFNLFLSIFEKIVTEYCLIFRSVKNARSHYSLFIIHFSLFSSTPIEPSQLNMHLQ